MAIRAPATPGAMAVRLAALARAMPEKVSMTPQTVPSKPMNGPPATAVERMIIPFSKARPCALAARSSETLTWSKDPALILVVILRAMMSVSAPIAPEPVAAPDFLELDDLDRIVLQVIFRLLRSSVVKLVGGRAVELLAAPG